MFDAFLHWLDRVPIEDQVDRRNARVVQLLFLFLALTIPATLAFALSMVLPQLRDSEVSAGTWISLSLSLLIAFAAASGLWLTRRGAMRAGVKLLLAVLLLVLSCNAAINGFQRQLPDQLAQMLVLILAGLVLGRSALWASFAMLVVMLVLGIGHDLLFQFVDNRGRAFYNVPSVLFSYLLVAILLDRTTEALRESLRESNARGERLRQEMVERERAQAQLIHAQKKDITERMASGVAHDFNNILAVIVGFAAERDQDDAEDAWGTVERLRASLLGVEESARRGLAISRRLLRFSRRDTEHVECFDAAEAVEQLQPMLRQLLESRITLDYQRPAQACWILFDRSQFELLLLNLASNARDAMTGDGHFAIRVRGTGAQVLIEVADDGHGMPPEVAARAFEPFYSTKPADSGTGLGLAVVHELITKAGGVISVDSVVDAGTRFSIVLPRVPQDQREAAIDTTDYAEGSKM